MDVKPLREQGGRWLVICTVFVAGFEGLYTHAYRDPVGVVTICYGATNDDLPVHMGDSKTAAECKALLSHDLIKYDQRAMRCVTIPVSDERRAAIVSFAYNVGVTGACRSSFMRRLNSGDPNACDALLAWNKAGGMVFRGLTRRRQAERQLCMKG